MDLIKELAEILQMTGGWGVAAVVIYAYVKKDREVASLNKEIRDSMLESTKELTTVIADNTHTAKQQVEESRETRRLALLPRSTQ